MAIEYTGLGGSDYDDMSKLSDSQLYDILLYGPNVSDPSLAGPIKSAAQAEQLARAGTYTPPTGNGMGAGGGQAGVEQIAPPTSVAPPTPLEPTYTPPAQPQPQDPFVPTGPSTAPPTNGMGPDGGQIQPTAPVQPRPDVDISQGGGFLPGSRNNQFYTNQFQGLLDQQAQFRDQEAQARELRASGAGQQGGGLSWDWLERPLPEVDWGDGTAGQGGQQQPQTPYIPPIYNIPTIPNAGTSGGGGSLIQGTNKPL